MNDAKRIEKLYAFKLNQAKHEKSINDQADKQFLKVER